MKSSVPRSNKECSGPAQNIRVRKKGGGQCTKSSFPTTRVSHLHVSRKIHIQRCIVYNIDDMTDYDHLSPQEYGHPSLHETENLAELLRCELPLQLQHELEGHFQIESGTMGKVMRDRLAGIVESVSQRIFETWRDYATATRITASETESSRASTLGQQYHGGTRVTEVKPVSSSTTSNVFDDKDTFTSDELPMPTSPPFEMASMLGFHCWQGADFYRQIDDKLLGSLLENEADLTLGVGAGAHVSYIGLLDHGLLPWDTTNRTPSNGTAENDDSES